MAKLLSREVINKRRNAPDATDDEKAIALVVLDAALAKDERLFGGDGAEVRTDYRATAEAARRLYLKAWPRCLDIKARRGMLYASRIDRWQELRPTPSGRDRAEVRREFTYQCLVCREDVGTLGDDGTRSVAPAFWQRLELHCIVCACRLVLGQIRPAKPRIAQLAKDDPPAPKKPRRKKRRQSTEARKERARQRRMARWPGMPGPG